MCGWDCDWTCVCFHKKTAVSLTVYDVDTKALSM